MRTTYWLEVHLGAGHWYRDREISEAQLDCPEGLEGLLHGGARYRVVREIVTAEVLHESVVAHRPRIRPMGNPLARAERAAARKAVRGRRNIA